MSRSPSTSHLLVLGDALLDVDVEGSVTRICPDAPVPVFDESEATCRPGGAALAATLSARSGAQVTLVTALGDDAAGDSLRRLLAGAGVEVVDLGLSGTTPEKVRLRADGHSVLRVDRGGPLGTAGMHLDEAVALLSDAPAVLVADYGRGITAVEPLRRALAHRRSPVVWDPHPRSGPPVRGTTVVTPSRAELFAAQPAPRDPQLSTSPPTLPPTGPEHTTATATATDMPLDATDIATVTARAQALARRWEVGAVAVTLGPAGALLTRAQGAPMVVPTRRVAATDPCGAGDAFASRMAVALAAGALLPEAVEEATAAATAFVEAGGAAGVAVTGTPAPAPLPVGGVDPAAPGERPLIDLTSAHDSRRPVVVATGGCFDLLHAGHVSLLEAAAALGDRLVVLLNSDRSVARLKGPDRPLQTEADRRAVLLALACVDDVVIFDETTPVRALEHLRPDIFVKGGDYAGMDLPESEVLERWGGQTAIVPYLDGRSTTRLVQEARRGS